MNDNDVESNQEDLSEFEDYLSRFDLLIKYDSETCSCCCVENSDSLPIQNSPFVLYKSITDDLELSLLTHKLKIKCIPFKIEKRLNNESSDQKSYFNDVMIPIKCLPEL